MTPAHGFDEDRHHAIALPVVPESSTKARRWVETKLGKRLGRDRLFDARLVVTELVNNAVLHARGRILRVEIDEIDDSVEIAVVDEGARMPQLHDPEPTWSTGRGLMIVDELSEDWGAAAEPPGKRVWARLSA
jgi:anti-sigma regulatory factor (Ser/Thr protein kinase)